MIHYLSRRSMFKGHIQARGRGSSNSSGTFNGLEASLARPRAWTSVGTDVAIMTRWSWDRQANTMVSFVRMAIARLPYAYMKL
jgi:hypothetical protein